jgi:protoheme IX farnesyltransferase
MLWKAYNRPSFYKQSALMAGNGTFHNSQRQTALWPLLSVSATSTPSLSGVSTCIIPKSPNSSRLEHKSSEKKRKPSNEPLCVVQRMSVRNRCYTTTSGVLEAAEGEAGATKQVGAGGEGPKVRTEPPPPPSLLTLYMRLSKVRLGAMVVLSTIFGYLLAPGAFDVAMFASTVIGTSFTVASANSINQYLEVEYDALMKRTKNRPLPAGHMTPNHALAFGVGTGALGTVILGTLVNPISATLAFSNIILYTLVYTPMKRVHPLNTAVGAIVGAIPPLIGWAAQTGGLEFGAWVAFLVMALWQMPHFHALSWPLRFDYGAAGYRMLSNVAPNRVPLHVLLYTVASMGLAPFAAYTGLATPHFALLGALPSLPWIYYAFKFYRDRSNINARQTYKWSLYWLPLFFALLAFSLSDGQDIDTIEEDVIAIHQQQQELLSKQNSGN